MQDGAERDKKEVLRSLRTEAGISSPERLFSELKATKLDGLATGIKQKREALQNILREDEAKRPTLSTTTIVGCLTVFLASLLTWSAGFMIPALVLGFASVAIVAVPIVQERKQTKTKALAREKKSPALHHLHDLLDEGSEKSAEAEHHAMDEFSFETDEEVNDELVEEECQAATPSEFEKAFSGFKL